MIRKLKELFEPRRFYLYRPSGWQDALFIGDDKQQIRNTIGHYTLRPGQGFPDLVVPEEYDITRKEKRIFLEFANGMSDVDHTIRIQPAEGFTFLVNANAYSEMEELVKNFEKRRRGDLIKFENPQGILYFIPPRMLENLRDYDWRKNDMQVNKWLVEQEIKFESLRQHRHLDID